MKGLLLKDFYVIRSGLLILLLTFVFVGAGMSFVISPWVLVVIFTVTLSFQSAVTVQTDKSSQWDRFSVTLPVSRKQTIASKYVMYLLLSLAGLATGTVISAICAWFQQGFDAESLLQYSSLAIIVSLLPGSISIPCSFLLDEEKSMVGMILAYMITSGIIVAVILVFSKYMNLQENVGMVIGILAVISVVLYVISWLVCPPRICKKDM
ncbi:ABC-2 transporter permease [Candidatus Bariatricus faecipullorum]